MLSVTVLECGLMHGLHFRKGCFVGQESISKTVSMTSNAVRRRLCALSLQRDGDAVMAGDTITDQDGECSAVVTIASMMSARCSDVCYMQPY